MRPKSRLILCLCVLLALGMALPAFAEDLHLFAGIPFGAGAQACRDTLLSAFGVTADSFGTAASQSLYVSDPSQVRWYGTPVVVDLYLLEDGLASAYLLYASGMPAGEAALLFQSLLVSLSADCGPMTDGYMVGMQNANTYASYHLPGQADAPDIGRAIALVMEHYTTMELLCVYGNVTASLYRWQQEGEAVCSISLHYDQSAPVLDKAGWLTWSDE